MKLTYYTIDDLTLPRKKFLRKGWSMKHFDTLEEAIKHYKTLPVQKKKELGLTDGAHVLELVQCVPLFAYDTQGEDVLACDYKQCPLWAEIPEAKLATQTCIREIHLRYLLCPNGIMPIPGGEELPKHLRDQYLWLNLQREKDSAIRWVYIAGTGWVSLEEWKRRAPSRPLVLKYWADGLTESGAYCPLEVEPWEYDLLVRRTLERLDQNTKKGGAKT